MRISPVNSYSTYNQKKSPKYTPFKAWTREVFETVSQSKYKKLLSPRDMIKCWINKDNKFMYLKHRNDTSYYRGAVFWNNLVKYLDNKYQDVEKLNVYFYGCSDASEVFTFQMSLDSNLHPTIAKKFKRNIIAKDYDKVAIKRAKTRITQIGEDEKNTINFYTNNQFDKYFKMSKKNNSETKDNYSISKELLKPVKFSVADIRKDYKKIKPNNSIVFVRNFWPYLLDTDKLKLSQNLYKQLDKNSTIIIGDYDLAEFDWEIRADKLLVQAGFKRVPNFEGWVFEK